MSHAVTISTSHSGNYTTSHALEGSSAGGLPVWLWSVDIHNRRIVINVDGTIKLYDLDGGGLLASLTSGVRNAQPYAYDTDEQYTLVIPGSTTNTVRGTDIKTYDYTGTLLGTIPDDTALEDGDGKIIYGDVTQYRPGLLYDKVLTATFKDETLAPIFPGSTNGAWTLSTDIYECDETGTLGSARGLGTALSGTWTISNNAVVRNLGSLIYNSCMNFNGQIPIIYYVQPAPTLPVNGYYVKTTQQIYGSGVRKAVVKYDGTVVYSTEWTSNLVALNQLYFPLGTPIKPYLFYRGGVYGTGYYLPTQATFQFHPTVEIAGFNTNPYKPIPQLQQSYWENVMIPDAVKIYVGKLTSDFAMQLYEVLATPPTPVSGSYAPRTFMEEDYFYYDHLDSGNRKITRVQISSGISEDIVVV